MLMPALSYYFPKFAKGTYSVKMQERILVYGQKGWL